VGCKGGQRDNCCGGNRIVSKKCRNSCNLCWYQGLSQPAPQMSYGVYLARKSNGASRPSGRRCCDCGKYSDCKANIAANPSSNPNTWKQSPNISSSTIIEKKRLAAITCARQQRKFKQVKMGKICISNKLDAKPPCSYYNSLTKQWIQPNKNPLTDQCTCNLKLKMKGRLGYTRINKNWCNTTKAVAQGHSASDQIASRKSKAFSCQCWKEATAQMVIGYDTIYNDETGNGSGGKVWGFHHAEEHDHDSLGSFSGTINGMEVITLDYHPDHGIYFEVPWPKDKPNPPIHLIKTITLVAPDGQAITLTFPPGTQYEPSHLDVLTNHIFWNIQDPSPTQIAFFTNRVGQCIKVYWTPNRTDQSQTSNTFMKCHKGRKLFKNPSVRCPSSSSFGPTVSLCS